MSELPINTIFTDIGGVLLTNGWDHNSREKASDVFHLDYEEMNERHHLTFDTYEEGKLSLDQYLNRVIFYKKQPFTREEFKEFMYAQSKPFPEMLAFMRELKKALGLKIVAVSNEGRELTEYRIKTFELGNFIDAFVSSCFVHFRKPDKDIFCIATDVSQVRPEQVAYIEDRQLYIEVANGLGLHGIKHVDVKSTRAALAALGIAVEAAPA